MLNIINSNQSIHLDKITIKDNIISQEDLIDNAGKAIAYHIIESIRDPFNSSFLCIAGIGNNGMDAIISNKYLIENNVDSQLLIVDPTVFDKDILDSTSYFTPLDNLTFSNYKYIVDGVFGTGLKREIAGIFYSTLEEMEKHDSIISIDIPSGIFVDSGNASNISITAVQTITFTYPKIGHYISKGYKASGELFIYPIGHSPDRISSSVYLIQDEDISKLIKPINSVSDKYSNGKVLSLSGSINYTGAALLSGISTLKAGAGILKQIFPLSLKQSFSQLKEAIDFPIDDKGLGYLTSSAETQISLSYDWPDCFLLGPGISKNAESIDLMIIVLSNYKGSCVIDATGLSAINFKRDKFSKIPNKSIITPHYTELARVLNISKKDLIDDVIRIVKDLSVHLEDRILILKGPNTIIVDGFNNIYILEKGTSILSTAGTGDVLSGIISSYVAAGYNLLSASLIGVSIHSHASQILEKSKIESIIASDLIPLIQESQNYFREIND